MMKTSTTYRLTALAVLLCAASLAWAADEPTTGEALVDHQAYQSWAKYKPGTQVTSTAKMDVQGQNITTEITSKLVEVTPEKAVTEITTKANVPGVNIPPQTRTEEIAAKVAKPEADLAALPEGMTGEVKEAGNEKVTIAGKEYECRVTEFTGEQQGMKVSGKVWSTMEIPGGIAKVESKATGEQSFSMTMSVDKIETK